MKRELVTLGQAKDDAKQLRKLAAETGKKIGHAQALEQIAHQNGFRDWNALAPRSATSPRRVGKRAVE